jgi:hypothetical protein
MESSSQSDQIEKLKKQLADVEPLLKASQGSITQRDENAAAQKVEMERLLGEVERFKKTAKDEEEKRVKAISLLKTVRQKLVKAEKERDDMQRETATSKEKEKADREREHLERSKLQAEVEMVNSEREKAVAGLKSQFDREVATIKDRHDKETAGIRGQFELEALTAKVCILMVAYLPGLALSDYSELPFQRNCDIDFPDIIAGANCDKSYKRQKLVL